MIKIEEIAPQKKQEKKRYIVNNIFLKNFVVKAKNMEKNKKKGWKHAKFECILLDFLYQSKNTSEELFKLENCASDALLRTKNNNFIILEFTPTLHNLEFFTALAEIMKGKYMVEEEWGGKITEGWIIFEKFTDNTDWSRSKKLHPARKPLEYINFFNKLIDIKLKLIIFEENQLIEYISKKIEN
ncbi:MAG: hypothetical protein ACTSRG_26320 [Candidatus Helarchaeota archaeon]